MTKEQIKQKYLKEMKQTKLILHISGDDLENCIKDSVLLSVENSSFKLDKKTNKFAYSYSTELFASSDLNEHAAMLSNIYAGLESEIIRITNMGNRISVSFFSFSEYSSKIIDPDTSRFLVSINSALFIYD